MDVRIALIGFGNVGQGVATLLSDLGELYRQTYGITFRLTGVADRNGAAVDANGLEPRSLLMAKVTSGSVSGHVSGKSGLRGSAFLDASRADVLLETSSSNYVDGEPGWSYVRAAFAQNMHVVLASKGALVLHWQEMTESAARHQLALKFAGTTGAPLPVNELAERTLIGARITSVEGILNGTTNQILTSMGEGLSYEEGVRRAQAIGIAETDPTLDVDGWDAAAKAVIVANSVFGANLSLADVSREGIRGVVRTELDAAARNDEAIKLIARVEPRNGNIIAEVKPERRGLADSLGRLSGADMGIVFHTQPLGDLTVTIEDDGSGVNGGLSTAMTVLRDVVNVCRESHRWPTNRQ